MTLNKAKFQIGIFQKFFPMYLIRYNPMLINVTHSMSCKQGPITLKNLKTKTPQNNNIYG